MPFAPTITNQGTSVDEQECYLSHENNNKDIIACLEAYRNDRIHDTGIIWGIGLIIIFFAVWETIRKTSK